MADAVRDEISPAGIDKLPSVGLETLRSKWGYFLALGVLLILGGSIAIGSALLTTVFSVALLGWLVLVSGVLEAIHAFTCKAWGGFFIDLLMGLLYAVVGFLMISNPGATAVALTLIISLLLMFAGVFRIVIAIAVRFPNWGWVLLNGVVTLLLGVCIWSQWPLSGLWVIGLFVGIELILNGWSLVMLGLVAKNLPEEPASEGA